MVYIICPGTWIVFINILVVFVSSWLGGSISNNGMFRAAYAKFYAKKRLFFAPAPYVFGIVWAILYALLIAAVFLFFLHDDTCKCDRFDPASYDGPFSYPPNGMACNTAYSGGKVQLATWSLIVINLFFNKLFDRLTSRWSFTLAALAMIDVLITFLTAVAVTVLLYYCAANIHSTLYVSAVFYTLYSVWLFVASLLSIYMYAYFEDGKVGEPLLKTKTNYGGEFLRTLKANKRK